MVSAVSIALTNGEDVERAICDFCNAHIDAFGLSRALNEEDLTAIRDTFERTYRTVTGTNENPHMDDFMILDKEARGETAKFVTHQGSICVNFAEIIDPIAASSNPGYFDSVRADFAIHPAEVPHRNESVATGIEIESLLSRVNNEQFERLPTATKLACLAHPIYQARHFLDHVAKGQQEQAELLLTTTAANTQHLLRTPGIFTDFSGRTFNCTAYEYAYWAKDTHMCRMLESHMDEETKAFMAARIDEMERIDSATGQPIGLVYSQAGQEHRSAHFDFTPLKEAYQRYLDGHDAWSEEKNYDAINAAWMDVRKAQGDIPAHVAQEYCRPDRTFRQTPEFNETTFPRELGSWNYQLQNYDFWFSLATYHSGAFRECAWIRGASHEFVPATIGVLCYIESVNLDFTAITRLDEVRTDDLTLSREHLNPPPMSQSMSV